MAKAAPDGYTIGMGPIGAMAINDLIAGHVQVIWESLNSIAPHARTDKIRALAVSGALGRSGPALGREDRLKSTACNHIEMPCG